MAVNIEPIAPGIVRLKIDGAEWLGIRISSHTKSVAGQFAETKKDKGWIVSGEVVREWEPVGFVEHEGAIYLYGAATTLEPLESLSRLDTSVALARLHVLAGAARVLAARSLTIPRPSMNGILVSGSEALFLPQAALDGMRTSQAESERIATDERFNHPDLRQERGFCFFLGALCYRITTGSFAYDGGTEEEIHERMREQPPFPPRMLVPEISPEVADAIQRALSPTLPASLKEWEEGLAIWARDGFTKALGDEERRELRSQGEKAKKRHEADFQRKSFLQRNARTIVVGVVIALVVAFIAGSFLKNELKPRITAGMGPAQVVNLYYASMSTFDSEAIQDCVVGRAGRAAINEAATLFVTSRVRIGYEGKSGYETAADWKNAGEPAPAPGISVYGLTDLKITQSGEGAFDVSYEKWVPVPPAMSADTDTAQPVVMGVAGTKQVDRVYLRNEGKFWAIYKIDAVSNDPINR